MFEKTKTRHTFQTTVLILGVIFSVAAPAAESLKDPTRPYHAAGASKRGTSVTNKYLVTAIFVSQQRRVAVVNGQLVTVGDRVGKARVSKILTDSVRLRIAGNTRTIRMAATRVRANHQN